MKYDLVFEGGGAKGIVFVGALEVLEQQPGYSFGRLLGTSAGAITATFVAAGLTANEMQSRMAETRNGRSIFANFLETPTKLDEAVLRAGAVSQLLSSATQSILPQFMKSWLNERLIRQLAGQPSLRRLLFFAEYGGWFAADNFLGWLREELNRDQPQKYGEMTLAEFFAATGVELSLAAANVTGQKLLILNHKTAPDLPLIWAVRMSMSVPFLWPEVVWQAAWGAYRNREATGAVVVDGGLLSNFPLELFVSNDDRVTSVVGPKESDAVLGLLIDESLPVPGTEPPEMRRPLDRISELRTVQRLASIVDTATSARDKMIIEAFKHLVVRLPAQGYGTTEFDMTETRRNLLIAAGRQAMRIHLSAAPQAAPGVVPLAAPPLTAAEEAQRSADEIALKILDEE